MNTYVTGTTIRQLREVRNMTQTELAERIGVSSKTISKWETAKGLPDISQSINRIAADGAEVEFRPQHIGGDVFIDNLLSVHQLNDGNAQGLGQGLQKGDVWQTPGSFPFGDCFAADTNFFCQLRLGQLSLLPKLPDGGSGYIGIHG